jgi:hypothetical protein
VRSTRTTIVLKTVKERGRASSVRQPVAATRSR